eukprot:8330399-Pyramimonas_sp.AAC.1
MLVSDPSRVAWPLAARVDFTDLLTVPECQATGRHRSQRPPTTSRGRWASPITMPHWLLTPSTLANA